MEDSVVRVTAASNGTLVWTKMGDRPKYTKPPRPHACALYGYSGHNAASSLNICKYLQIHPLGDASTKLTHSSPLVTHKGHNPQRMMYLSFNTQKTCFVFLICFHKRSAGSLMWTVYLPGELERSSVSRRGSV